MEEHKGYFIRGMSLPVDATVARWRVAGTVLKRGRAGSVIEITRFELRGFETGMAALAAWFGLELARMLVDECLHPLRHGR